MHNQVEADVSEIEMADAFLMRRLERDQIINRVGTAVEYRQELHLPREVSAEALDRAIIIRSARGEIKAPLADHAVIADLRDESKMARYLYLELGSVKQS